MPSVGGYAVMLLGPKGARASLICVAALGILALSILSAALGAHFKGMSLRVSESDPRLLPAALNPDDASEGTGGGSLFSGSGRPVVSTMVVAKGDTLMDLLLAAGSDGTAADAAIRAIEQSFNPRKLRAGQKLTVVLNPPAEGESTPMLSAVSLTLDVDTYVVVRRTGERFVVSRADAPAVPQGGDEIAAMAPGMTLKVRKNDTLNSLLQGAGANPLDAEAAAVALARHYDPRRLRVGQELTVVFEVDDDTSAPPLAAASLILDDGSYAVASRAVDGGFRARKSPEPLVSPLPTAIPRASPESTDRSRQVQEESAIAEPTPVQLTPADEEKPVADGAAPAPDTEPITRMAALVPASEPIEDIEAPRPNETSVEEAPAPSNTAPSKRAVETVLTPAPPRVDADLKTVRARKGDTLTRLLRRAGSDKRDAYAAIAALSKQYDPRRLRPGQELVLAFAGRNSDNQPSLAAVSVTLGENSYVVAGRGEEGGFTVTQTTEPLSSILDTVLAALPAAAVPEIVFLPEPDGALRKDLSLASGDTLMDTLLRAGSGRQDAYAAIAALRTRSDPRKLKTGQRLTIVFAPERRGEGPVLHSLSLADGPGRRVEASRAETGEFAVREIEIPMERVLVHAGSRINSSLYQSAAKAGVPLPVMMEIIRAFSFDVDFQRDIQRGDAFAVLFERYVGDAGDVVREGRLLYAALTLGGSTLKIYRYQLDDDFFDYFTDDGQSIRKALLRTPVNGARLSSGFGKRKHPILGYTKMHRGLDFAAPSGTPVFAAGNGVIERISRTGAYGNYIRIRHKGQYSTAYAHMKGFAKGMKKGGRVRQGEVIGYVGSSGRSTGPHLHYEVLAGGRQINPLKLKIPTGPKLKGNDLTAFQQARAEIERQIAALPLVRHVADSRGTRSACDPSIELVNGPVNESATFPERC